MSLEIQVCTWTLEKQAGVARQASLSLSSGTILYYVTIRNYGTVGNSCGSKCGTVSDYDAIF